MNSLINEQWSPVVGWEGIYEISSCGRIKSIPRTRFGGHQLKEKILRPYTTRKGYLMIVLVDKASGRKKQHVLIHRLVAEAFLGKPPTEDHQVNHKNGVKAENFPSNLEWMTCKQNLKHARDNGLWRTYDRRGEKNPAEDWFTHDDLLYIADRYAATTWGILWGLIEPNFQGLSNPDLIPDWFGFKGNVFVPQIECKRTRADFLADLRKKRQFRWGRDIGSHRMFLCPEGVIEPTEVMDKAPEGWGLAWCNRDGESWTRIEPEEQPWALRDTGAEFRLLAAAYIKRVVGERQADAPRTPGTAGRIGPAKAACKAAEYLDGEPIPAYMLRRVMKREGLACPTAAKLSEELMTAPGVEHSDDTPALFWKTEK